MSHLKKDAGSVQRAVQLLAGTYDKDLLSFEIAKVVSVDTANWLCTARLISGNTGATEARIATGMASGSAKNTYTNIQLTAERASNGFIQVPKVNSNVILAITLRKEVYVFMCSEIDALVFHQKNLDGTYEEFVINCNSTFNSSLPLGIQIIDGGGNGVVISSGGGSVSNSIGNNGVVISSGTGPVSNTGNGIVINNSTAPPSNSDNGILISCSGTMQLNDGSYNGIPIASNLAQKLNNLENLVNTLVSAWHSFAVGYVPGSPSTTGLPPVAADVAGSLILTRPGDIENGAITHGPQLI